jgi:glucose/arabinose dehydrogenase
VSATRHYTQVVQGLSFPTGVTFDDDGTVYVAESGLPFGGAPAGGRIVEVRRDGTVRVLRDGLQPPVNGVTWHQGSLFISEGGHPARISRLDPSGAFAVIVDGLPGPGNYHTNMVAFGQDGRMYFSQGAMTNSGIVGLDAYEIGWLKRLPHAHDLPGYDLRLTDVSAATANPLGGASATARTGAFAPFGSAHPPGSVVRGQLPCTAAVMRCRPDGRDLELVAWGLRNAYGLGFLPDGRLLATDQGADDRGSRPIGNAPDLLFEVRQNHWYGWPDFISGEPITAPTYRPTRGAPPRYLLANHDELPPPEPALLRFPPHSCAVKFDHIPHPSEPGWWIVVALFGDETPMTAPVGPLVGRSLAVIDPRSWSLHAVRETQLHRPIDVRYQARRRSLYVLDFGRFEITARGVEARAGTGRLWEVALSAFWLDVGTNTRLATGVNMTS